VPERKSEKSVPYFLLCKGTRVHTFENSCVSQFHRRRAVAAAGVLQRQPVDPQLHGIFWVYSSAAVLGAVALALAVSGSNGRRPVRSPDTAGGLGLRSAAAGFIAPGLRSPAACGSGRRAAVGFRKGLHRVCVCARVRVRIQAGAERVTGSGCGVRAHIHLMHVAIAARLTQRASGTSVRRLPAQRGGAVLARGPPMWLRRRAPARP